MASESAHFKQQAASNLNPIANGSADWQEDNLLKKQKDNIFARVSYELNSGIIQQLALKR